jgi:hypothetical protein
MKVTDKEYISGWYPTERDDKGPFRWMGKEAKVSFLKYPDPGKKFLRITAGHSFPDKELPTMDVFVNDEKIGSREVEAAYAPYVFSFESAGPLHIQFNLSRTVQIYGDPREMGIMVRDIEILFPSEIDVFLDGWYLPEESLESQKEDKGRWMTKEAKCLFTELPRDTEKYLLIEAGHPYDDMYNPILTVLSDGKMIGSREILSGETEYYFPLDSASKLSFV